MDHLIQFLLASGPLLWKVLKFIVPGGALQRLLHRLKGDIDRLAAAPPSVPEARDWAIAQILDFALCVREYERHAARQVHRLRLVLLGLGVFIAAGLLVVGTKEALAAAEMTLDALAARLAP